MKRKDNEVSVSRLRDELPDLLARVALLGESFTITKNGKPCASIAPVTSKDDETAGGRPAKSKPYAKAEGGR